ncbi:MAG: hypothetical protein JXX28_09150 [Deltaproteobacteria bacterium]|nr:hypothetical protein [Deltaproteobacteria bacterium]
MPLLLLLSACTLSFPVSVETAPTVIEGNLLCPDPSLAELLPSVLEAPVVDVTRAVLQGAFDLLGPEIEDQVDAQANGPAKEAYLTALTLTQSPVPASPQPTDSLGFLAGLEVEVVGASGLPRRTVAWAEDIPEDAVTIALIVDDTLNLQPYLEQGAEVSASPLLRTCPREDVQLSTSARVRVGL